MGLDFDDFVSESTDGLLRTAYLIVWELHEAEDLVQETLFRVARRWGKVRRMDHPAAYARRILVNLALRGKPKQSRRQAALMEPRPSGLLRDRSECGVRQCVELDQLAPCDGSIGPVVPLGRSRHDQ